MKISEVLNGVYDRSVGWRPSSGAIKPVHIANGLFRDLLGEQYDIKRPVAFAVPWRKKGDPEPDPKRTYQHLVDDTADPRFQAFRGQHFKDRFEKLREFTRGLLAADGAVFPQADYTSLTLSCRQMISPDRNDRDVGRFMAEILRGRGGTGSLAKVVADCLVEDSDRPRDPISLLVWPLLSQDSNPIVRKSTRCSPHDNSECREFFGKLEEAAHQLAGHETQQGNRLATLQRSVQFCCLALIAHAQALAAGGVLAARSPLLLVPEAPKGSRLALASEESLNSYYDTIEDWLALMLGRRIEKGEPVAYGSKDEDSEDVCLNLPAVRKDSVRRFLAEILTEKGEPPKPDVVDERMSLYERALVKHGRADWPTVIGETLVQSYVNEYTSGGPRQFLGGVGRKVGLVYPHFQGNSRDKRIRPSVAILDVLVKCCTPTGEPIPLTLFLDRLWERFGIIVGGRQGDDGDDLALLRRRDIDVSPTDLEENTQALVDELVQVGLARRYPDNISYVGRYHV